MPIERTLSIIKPDAVAKDVIGEIYSRFEQAGLKIIAARMKLLSTEDAAAQSTQTLSTCTSTSPTRRSSRLMPWPPVLRNTRILL